MILKAQHQKRHSKPITEGRYRTAKEQVFHRRLVVSIIPCNRKVGDDDGYIYKPMKKQKIHAMDLISDLPDPIVHHIMSFLSTMDVTKLSILSKRFFFLWGSFPVIDLDQSRFSRTFQGTCSSIITNRFIDHVHNTVQLRTTDTVLSAFRVNANLEGIWSDPRFDSAILIVLSNGVKCMELNLGFGWYRLPPNFASGSINVLRLKDLQLDLCKLIQVCPLLKTVSLTSCLILQDIKFSSKTLTEIELHSCVVNSIKINNAPNLRLFLFSSDETDPNPCQIDVLQCQNIVYFSLNNVVKGRVWIEQHVYALSKLKTLILNGCEDIEQIRVSNDKLERVELTNCPVLTSIELKCTSLESFVYKGVHRHMLCNITLLALECIKDLSITGPTLITDQWLEAQIAKMTRLKNLRLIDCNSLKKIKVYHEKLQNLELNGCDGLLEADIDTPALVSFVYCGGMIEVGKMVTHGNCGATLCMNPWITYDNEKFCRWRNLLSFFGHCKALKLICSTHKEVMIPDLHREILVSPLYDLQHLEIQIKSLEKIDRDLVDSLLWLSPLPKTLHVSSGSSSRLQMIIKFLYSDMIEGEEDKNPFCCEIKPIKCWKHHLKRMEIQNSGVSPNESIELQKYFLKNSKISDSFCISS